jgi:orotidine-5'-phosphate decarboxylase
MVSKVNDPKIILALDFSEVDAATVLLEKLDPAHCRIKIGKELFTCSGPQFVDHVIKLGFDVFLDLKFHDIPTTVAKACVAAANLGVWMINIHATGGKEMLLAARSALSGKDHKPLLIAVTVLTSLNTSDLKEVGITRSVDDQVLAMARLAKQCGLDGVVCSVREVQAIRKITNKDFILVTPGIRQKNSDRNDQSRVMTPTEAIRAGSDYLVIGRSITRAADPMEALRSIEEEIKNAVCIQ